MEINIKLNDFKYRYDVFQMFNIYFPLYDLKFSEEVGEYVIAITDETIDFNYKDIIINESLKDTNNPKDIIKKVIFEALQEITEDYYPWGTLVGIRPSKIALKHLREGKSHEEIIDIIKDKHDASRDKAELCIEDAEFEDRFVNND